MTEQSELERARIQAEVADEAKTRLLAQISLEIRTPAGAVFGNADELVDPHLTGAEAAAAVGAIRSDGQDPLCILDLAKVEAGKLENMDSII